MKAVKKIVIFQSQKFNVKATVKVLLWWHNQALGWYQYKFQNRSHVIWVSDHLPKTHFDDTPPYFDASKFHTFFACCALPTFAKPPVYWSQWLGDENIW